MELFPAIDVLDGRCVRLYQGDFDSATVYGNDPVAQARAFAREGATWLHVVDLDAARTGEARNGSLVAEVARRVDVGIQVGGGIRTDAAADALLESGATRVVVGTAAVRDPKWAARLARRHPGRVAIGLDADGRDLAVHGWTERTGRDVVAVARHLQDVGVAALVVTQIGRDGTLSGPDVDQLAAVLDATSVDVVASGGVGSLDDLRALHSLRAGSRALSGVIVGRALYEGVFSVAEAVALLSVPTEPVAGAQTGRDSGAG